MTAMSTIHNNISNWTNGSNLSRILKERHIREPVQRTQKCSNWGQIKLRCGIEHSANDWNSAGTGGGGSFLFCTSSHKYVSIWRSVIVSLCLLLFFTFYSIVSSGSANKGRQKRQKSKTASQFSQQRGRQINGNLFDLIKFCSEHTQ